IRDFHVTGVQTCALPISDDNGVRRRQRERLRVAADVVAGCPDAPEQCVRDLDTAEARVELGGILRGQGRRTLLARAGDDDRRVRSEERRVGEGWWCGRAG